MKLDRQQKRARMGKHIPDFPGYSALNYAEMDRQLRRLLAGEMEKVRDRLAGLLAGEVPHALRESLAAALRESAALKELFSPPAQGTVPAAPPDEERILDLDLALLDRIAALHSPLDRIEGGASAADLQGSVTLLREGLREAEELFERRQRLLAERGSS